MTKLIRLDIGCGSNKQEGFIGIDVRDLEGVDIIHDLEDFPWPMHDESVHHAIAGHVVEHIRPQKSIEFMDEVWRVLVVGGSFAIATPYPGSRGYWQDPTHCNGWNEASFQYFDPRYPLYSIYSPKPWKIRPGFPTWQMSGNLEVIMDKLPLDHDEKVLEGLVEEAKEEESPPDLGINVSETVKMEDKLV